jgi:hypothetical protein
MSLPRVIGVGSSSRGSSRSPAGQQLQPSRGAAVVPLDASLMTTLEQTYGEGETHTHNMTLGLLQAEPSQPSQPVMTDAGQRHPQLDTA